MWTTRRARRDHEGPQGIRRGQKTARRSLTDFAASELDDMQGRCPAFSFDSDTLTVNSIQTDPTVNPSAIVADLETVALPGFDKMDVLVTVHLAQNDITDSQVVWIRRDDCAQLPGFYLPAH